MGLAAMTTRRNGFKGVLRQIASRPLGATNGPEQVAPRIGIDLSVFEVRTPPSTGTKRRAISLTEHQLGYQRGCPSGIKSQVFEPTAET
jgi:hypothetical protein